MWATSKKIILLAVLFCGYVSAAESLSVNGYSGLGLVPSAKTLQRGKGVFLFDNAVAGAVVPEGYNYNLGIGLTDRFELTGRLATHNLKCNYFRGECPPNTIRDVSASFKYSVASGWLTEQGVNVAVGATDVSGAATLFRTYYGVVGKSWKDFELTLGYAQSKARYALVDGPVGSVQWRPTENFSFSIEKAGKHEFAHAGIELPTPFRGVSGLFKLSHRISESPVTPRTWVGFGVSFPLQTVGKQYSKKYNNSKTDLLIQQSEADLSELLTKNGFYKYKIGKNKFGKIIVILENQAYDWNTIDAAGVASGIIASIYGFDPSDPSFDLTIVQSGMQQLRFRGKAQCLRLWLQGEKNCEEFILEGVNQAWMKSEDPSSDVSWFLESAPDYRPEVVLSPRLVNAIGTELGAFDTDLGLNISIGLPLWPGAIMELNRVEPINLKSRNFHIGQPLYLSRIYPTVSRRLLHQVINFSTLNTAFRLSYGEINDLWTGMQIHLRSVTPNGRHSLELQGGDFEIQTSRRLLRKNYTIGRYVYAFDDARTSELEFEAGKYWNDDNGYKIAKRHWYGDTALAIYFKRTTMPLADKHVSFAGFELSVPLTPRKNVGWKHFGIRGASEWRHKIETKIMENDNIITSGHGFLPDLGEGMQRLSNRGRNTTQYYSANLWRLRSAYWDLRKP